MKLETKIKNLISEAFPDLPENALFDVRAHGLLHDGYGWSSNDVWRIASSVTLEGVLDAARGRWEIFKINYSPKATVKGIQDYGWKEEMNLESDGLPFLDIVPVRYTLH